MELMISACENTKMGEMRLKKLSCVHNIVLNWSSVIFSMLFVVNIFGFEQKEKETRARWKINKRNQPKRRSKTTSLLEREGDKLLIVTLYLKE